MVMVRDVKNRVICAIDVAEMGDAAQLVRQVVPYVGMIKLGLEFFTANGAHGVEEIARLGVPIFLDLKFHDIPATVAGAVRSACALPGVELLTIHACGGAAMMEAACAARDDATVSRPKILAVTVLTSMDEGDISQVGIDGSVEGQISRLATLARDSGVDGCVCSPMEIGMLRDALGSDMLLVTPGVRPASAASDDQKRTATPQEALNLGADYIVIGRPITHAANPAHAARDIL